MAARGFSTVYFIQIPAADRYLLTAQQTYKLNTSVCSQISQVEVKYRHKHKMFIPHVEK